MGLRKNKNPGRNGNGTTKKATKETLERNKRTTSIIRTTHMQTSKTTMQHMPHTKTMPQNRAVT